MTKSELITDLKAIIGPGNTRDDSQLGTWVNGAYMYMVDEITKVNPDYFTKAVTTNVYANQQEYTLPTDFEKIIAVNIEVGGVWVRALPLNNLGDVQALANTTSTQGFSYVNPRYYIYNQILGFMPIPTDNVTSGIKIWYVYTPTTLSLDTEEPDIPKKYHYLIKYGAYADYLDQDDSHNEALRMRQQFQGSVSSMADNIADSQVDQPKSIQVVTSPDLYISSEDGIL